jgi:hypothetical protein
MSEPICARAAALEQSLWEGTIKPEQETELKEHARECAECAAILAGIDRAKYGVASLKNEEIPVPSVEAAWQKVESRLVARRMKWYQRTRWMAVAATIVVAVGVSYVALEGTSHKFPVAPMIYTLTEGTMGQNQAALRGGVYDEAVQLTAVTAAAEVAPDVTIGFEELKAENEIAYRAASPSAVIDGERLHGGALRPGGEPGVYPTAATPRVERAASITMGVTDARDAFKTVTGLVASGGGQIVTSRVSQPSGASGAEARLTVRVPVARFDGFVHEIHDLGAVLAEDIQGMDRTGQYSDIQGRLDDKDSVIAALRTRLAQTGLTRDEVRRIETELNRVRVERDRIESARRQLAGRTDFATLELMLREEKAAPGAVMIHFESLFDSFGDSLGIALNLFNGGLSIMVIGLGACLPWFLLGAAIRTWWRRRALAW